MIAHGSNLSEMLGLWIAAEQLHIDFEYVHLLCSVNVFSSLIFSQYNK
jgi:hypothetical protein